MIKCNNSKKRNSQNKTKLMAIIGQGLKSVLRYVLERWITYAKQALSLLNHEVMWKGIVEACKIFKYPEPLAMHRDYFETLFDMSCFIWFQIYSESKRTECISNLIDYIICVCKLKFTSTV